MEITEKEFAVIMEIHDNQMHDQRTIAGKTGISLGLTNLLIRRLIKKGYVKAKQLNQNKMQYLLTRKGFSEKANKSYEFTRKTINLVKSIKHRLHELIMIKHAKGISVFQIVGNNEELEDILQIIFRSLNHLSIKYSVERKKDKNQMAYLKCIDPVTKVNEKIDLIEYLSNTGTFWQ